MSEGVTLDFTVHFSTGRAGQRVLHAGAKQVPTVVNPGRVPRLAKLMALAIRFEDLVRRGEATDFSEIAALGHVTRARISQIVNLLNLAPSIQEEILFMTVVGGDRDAMPERRLRTIAAEPDWERQRVLWKDAQRSPSTALA